MVIQVWLMSMAPSSGVLGHCMLHDHSLTLLLPYFCACILADDEAALLMWTRVLLANPTFAGKLDAGTLWWPTHRHQWCGTGKEWGRAAPAAPSTTVQQHLRSHHFLLVDFAKLTAPMPRHAPLKLY